MIGEHTYTTVTSGDVTTLLTISLELSSLHNRQSQSEGERRIYDL